MKWAIGETTFRIEILVFVQEPQLPRGHRGEQGPLLGPGGLESLRPYLQEVPTDW
jgi:hypothetical protein